MTAFRILGAAIAAAVTMVLAAAQPFRGLNLWALWVVDATERFAVWRGTGTEPAAVAAFADPNGVLPLGPWLASVVGGGDPLLGARLAAVLAAGVVAAVVFDWGRALGGRLGAIAAVGALLCQPRFWAAATVPAPTVFAVAGGLVLWRVTLSARDRLRWTPAAAVLGAAGLATGLPAWTMLLPLAWVVLIQPGSLSAGLVRIRATGLWTLALPAVWMVLLVLAVTWLRDDTAERLGRMIGLWIERPAEPFFAGGTFWGVRRMTPWTPLAMIAVTTPAALLVAALAAVPRGDGFARDERQSLGAYVIWALALPVVLRSVFHGGVDLLVFGGVAVALCVGAGAARVTGVGRPSRLSVAAVAVALVVSAVETVGSSGPWEAWRSGLVGGTPGAAARGYSRYPHGPVPPQVLIRATDRGARRFAVLANEWEIRPVFEWYARRGVLPADAALVHMTEADAVVLALDDALPELYGVLSDWVRFATSSPDDLVTLDADGLNVFAVGLLR